MSLSGPILRVPTQHAGHPEKFLESEIDLHQARHRATPLLRSSPPNLPPGRRRLFLNALPPNEKPAAAVRDRS